MEGSYDIMKGSYEIMNSPLSWLTLQHLDPCFTQITNFSRIVDAKETIKFIDMQVDSLEEVIHEVEVTRRAIDTFPPETKIYEPVGRLFLITTVDELKENLKCRENRAAARITELTTSKEESLAKTLKNSNV